ncbi:DUF4394 domain-containing protein [Acinetobacter sp. WCHAc060042]|uniref:DUF4394 domain-containing protein n=1 Tax=Acinetobacter sp. WCHAc060042 TaxID=2213016 RepID=UPI000DA66B4B|nr:DUF4394 domain-containing protein [Acinetobacter sp. WCHAc060042]
MIKSITNCALVSISCFLLVGCNTNSEKKEIFLPTSSGDTIILTNNGLITSINRELPNSIISSVKISMLEAGDQLVGIDYRPKDEKLYAIGVLGNIYTLNPNTGVATFLRKLFADPTDTNDGNTPFLKILGDANLISVNFNPVADRLRVITNTGQNLRINVDTGATITDGQISSTSISPVVMAAAYTNAFAGTATTKLYSIDQVSGRVYLQNANAGTLGVSAPLGDSLDKAGGGFDIDPVNNVGYAALKVSGSYKFYQLNLANVGTSNNAIFTTNELDNTYTKNGIRGIALKRDKNATAEGFGLSTNNKLIRFALNNPNSVIEKRITGLLVDEKLIGIDFRLRTNTDQFGKLYGLTNKGNIYVLNTETGETSLVSVLRPALNSTYTVIDGTDFAVDFNPAADRLRVISNTGQSLRINVDTGETIQDGNINGISSAIISAAAYTNSFKTSAPSISTELFDLEQTNKTLVKQDPPNTGVLNPIGGLGISLGLNNGFDIVGGDNGYALASIASLTAGPSVLYRIDISTSTMSDNRAKPAISIDGTPNVIASTIGTEPLIDIALLLK